jgi:tetratricopeptide (TPR) repeat protein
LQNRHVTGKAIVVTPAELFSLAWQQHQTGEIARAEQLYRQVLQSDPQHADAWCFLGAACQAQGRLAEAENCFRRAVQIIPSYAVAYNWLGMLLAQQGRFEEGVVSFQQGLSAQPGNVQILNNLGLALNRLGKAADAVGAYRQALQWQPENASTRYNLGLSLNALGRHDEAIVQFQEALRVQQQFPEAWTDLGNALAQKESLAESVDCFERALRIRPEYSEAHYNLGVVLVKQGRAEEAMAHYRQAFAAKPDYADAHFNLGNTLHGLGRMEEALAEFLEALRLRPNHPETNLSCALVWLALGDFKRGWPAYDWREKQPDAIRRTFAQPRWDGSPLQGRTILLHAELGLGDTLQFIRFVPLVKERGAKVILECQAALCHLLKDIAGTDHLIARNSPSPRVDMRAPLLSLPALLHITLSTLPAKIPYLHADSALVAHWNSAIGEARRAGSLTDRSSQLSPLAHASGSSDFLVGIAWQGNPQYGHDRQRSIPLKEVVPLAQVPGIRLVSLQKGTGADQLQVADFQIEILRPTLDENCGAFMDTAALMRSLDVVVTSDTAIAHLAGALGVPVWVALAKVSDWRWLLEREDSPWYPTMRLFRQTQPGDWREVFARIADELKKRASVEA